MLSSLTITEAHQKLSAKDISCEELTMSCLDRIASVDDDVQAVVSLQADKALHEARQLDANGTFDHLLTGIPFLTKDAYCEVGVPTTAASEVLQDKTYEPPFTATTVKRLEQKHALSMGKVNTDQFMMGSSTEHSCYKTTRCPWDTTRVAGGTSGGSAAATVADECIFAIGTDTGGSIRQPAAFCGCTGMRVTYGRTSRYGAIAMASSFDTTGALTKTVEDMAIVLSAIAGKDEHDATTGSQPVPDYASLLTGDVSGMKIGLPKEYFIDELDNEIATAVRDAAAVLEQKGAKLVDVSLPHTKYAVASYYILVASENSSNMARYDGLRFGHTVDESDDLIDYYIKVRSEGFGDEVKRRIMLGAYALSAGYYDAYYRKAQKVRRLIKQDFDEVFSDIDLILSPVSPTPAFEVGAHTGDPVAMYLEDIFTLPQSLAGMPCISVPCGFSKNNLPIGLQLTGPQWSEERVLNAAHTYQLETDWHTKKPSL